MPKVMKPPTAPRQGQEMTLQRFQGIVLRLGNQMFVRHYLWVNYPHDPQLLGIEFIGQGRNGSARVPSCTCGTCEKCKHREYVRSQRPKGRHSKELEELGFRFSAPLGIWTIARAGERSTI